MNALVLVRVAAALDRSLTGARLRQVRQEPPHRFRFRFETADGTASLVVSLRPGRPWIGRPRTRAPRSTGAGGPFAAACQRALGGAALRAVRQGGAERLVRLEFTGGRTLVAELPAQGATLLLLDARGSVEAAARQPRRGRERRRIGATYAPPRLPEGKLDPFSAGAEAIDALVDERVAAGELLADVLLRRIFGLGPEGVERVLAERRGGASPGAIVARRIAELAAGRADPVLDGPEDPLEAAGAGGLPDGAMRLWPWEPDAPPDAGATRHRESDAASTAGLYHEALDLAHELAERGGGLLELARRERARLARAAGQAAADLAGFADPEAHRRAGEALLAGLSQARIEGDRSDRVRVPDPYGPPGTELTVRVEPGLPLTDAAQACFAAHRRALRGEARARERLDRLHERGQALDAVLERHAGAAGREAVTALEAALRTSGMPVALEPETRAGRSRRRTTPPRLEGVRVLTARTGESILIGKGGRGNDRLTFKLAAPEDLWFHALGLPGAHVVVRDPGRAPAEALLREAAAAAAWYSDGRKESRLDVQWTRRKYVRRRRGGPPGAVLIKKFDTVRVRPALPGRAPD